MSANDQFAVDVRHISKHFPLSRGVFRQKSARTVKAVDDVTLQIRKGETLGLVGESGCGKSSLAKLIMALETPTSGEIVVSGRNLFDLSRRELRAARRHIQIVLQDPYTSLDPRMTVGQIVGEPLEIHPEVAPRASRPNLVRELLEVVGLNPDYINRYAHQFSGGQRQRIGIARALALRPDVIICDEPVSALDVSVRAQIINLLAGLQTDFGLSYLFVSHDLSVVRHVSDRVAVMYLGRIVEIGTHQDIFEHATHPYTQALLSAVPKARAPEDTGQQRIILRGEVPSAIDPPSGCTFRTRCWKARDICGSAVPLLTRQENDEHFSACLFAEEVPTS